MLVLLLNILVIRIMNELVSKYFYKNNLLNFVDVVLPCGVQYLENALVQILGLSLDAILNK